MAEQVGIVGVPPLEVIATLNREGARIFDLDEPQPQVRVPIEQSAAWVPRVYCAILRTVVLNAMLLELDRIFIDVGPGKCDAALNIAEVLDDMLAIPIHRTHNQDRIAYGFPLCTSAMPMVEKFTLISKSVQKAIPHQPREPCTPLCGFWGVPPRDFALLHLFPEQTHVFGWTRCMENKTPADLELERQFDPSLPTVFFTQTFCAKSALAHHLGRRHPQALVIDCDVSPSNSARAKIEAFLELSGVPSSAGALL